MLLLGYWTYVFYISGLSIRISMSLNISMRSIWIIKEASGVSGGGTEPGVLHRISISSSLRVIWGGKWIPRWLLVPHKYDSEEWNKVWVGGGADAVLQLLDNFKAWRQNDWKRYEWMKIFNDMGYWVQKGSWTQYTLISCAWMFEKEKHSNTKKVVQKVSINYQIVITK